MPYATVNGIKLYYEVHGEGFPLVMIMGLGADSNWWPLRIIKEFSKDYSVVVLDNRGAGRSDKPDSKYTIDLMADDVLGLMDYLGIRKAHILGVSMGGMIAQSLAIRYPEVVGKLVLCVTSTGGPEAVPPTPEAMKQLLLDRSSVQVEVLAEMLIETLLTKEYVEEHREELKSYIKRALQYPMPAHAYNRQLEAILEFNAYDKLDKIRASTLVISGGKDIIIPPDNGRLLAKKIPNSRLVIFENSGHGLILQELDRFVSVVMQFLQSGS
ncbi:MAG: alpha/beta hydrolase [Desulfurococcales archaeon]|nr:alpha/beta hydrolase [Desulfurococcales archaeon]